MRISAKALINYLNVNSFDYANQWQIRAGEPNTLYFQLIDLDKDGHRYMAGVGVSAGVQVTFPSINDAAVIQASATPDSYDSSIWAVTLSASQIPNSGNVVFSITEGSVTRKFSVLNMIAVEFPGNDGSC